MTALGTFLAMFAFILFVPKGKKKTTLTLHEGGKSERKNQV
jgi:hypothetical protein